MPEVLSAYASRQSNPDGSVTLTTTQGKSWYQDNGVWLPIDITASRQVAGDIIFSALADGTKVTLSKSSLTYTLEKGGLTVSYIGPAATFVDAVGNLVTYTLSTGETFQFLLTRTGVKALTRIAKAGDAAPTWKMAWDAKLTPELEKTGDCAYCFKDQNGVEQFHLLQPVIYDVNRSQIRSGDVVMDKQTGDLAVVLSEAGLTKPFLVDPTSTFNPSAGDGYVRYVNVSSPAWASVITQTDGTSTSHTDTEGSNPVAGFSAEASPVTFGRHFEAYDTSTLADNAVISAATITKYLNDLTVGNADTQSYNYFEGTQASTSELVLGDMDAHGTTAWATAIAYTSLSLGANPAWTANIWTLNASGIAGISKTGFTKFCFRNSADYNAVAPTSGANNYFRSANSEDANQPVLSVTFTVPSGEKSKRGSRLILGLP